MQVAIYTMFSNEQALSSFRMSTRAPQCVLVPFHWVYHHLLKLNSNMLYIVVLWKWYQSTHVTQQRSKKTYIPKCQTVPFKLIPCVLSLLNLCLLCKRAESKYPTGAKKVQCNSFRNADCFLSFKGSDEVKWQLWMQAERVTGLPFTSAISHSSPRFGFWTEQKQQI